MGLHVGLARYHVVLHGGLVVANICRFRTGITLRSILYFYEAHLFYDPFVVSVEVDVFIQGYPFSFVVSFVTLGVGSVKLYDMSK